MSGQSSPSLVSSPLSVATVRAAADVDEGASMLHDHEMCAVTGCGSCG